jgi:hypothetical protein
MRPLAASLVLVSAALSACSSGGVVAPAKVGAPMSTTLRRSPAACPIVRMEAPLDPKDTYELAIEHFTIDDEGLFAFYITTSPSVPVGRDLVVPLDDLVGSSAVGIPTTYWQTGEVPLSTGSLRLDWSQDTRADPVLVGPATVRVLSFPAQDGELMRVRIDAGLADGRWLELEAGAPLPAAYSLTCPAG